MISTDHSCPFTSVITSFSSRYYNTSNRSKSKHDFLRSRRRRRSYSLSTPILIFWPPRSLYSYSSRIWYHLACSYLLFWKKRTIWIYGYSMSHDIYWLPRIYCMSTPHIHSRSRRRHTSLFYICYYNYCHPHRCKSIQLTCNLARRKY